MLKKMLFCSLLVALMPLATHAAKLTQSGVAAQPKAPANMPETFKFDPQLQQLDTKVARLVGPESQKALRLMAEAAVLADYCATMNLDQAKFKRDFDALSGQGTKRTPVDQRKLENNLMTYFGVYVGLLIAEASESQVGMCDLGQYLQQSQRPVSQYWLPVAANAPSAPAAPAGEPKAK